MWEYLIHLIVNVGEKHEVDFIDLFCGWCVVQGVVVGGLGVIQGIVLLGDVTIDLGGRCCRWIGW